MCNSSCISKIAAFALGILLMAGCGSRNAAPEFTYYIHSQSYDSDEVRVVEAIKKQLVNRSGKKVCVNSREECDLEVTVRLGDDFDGDYAVTYGNKECTLTARNTRIMTWLFYQFIKHQGRLHSEIKVDDLPPDFFPVNDTVATMPFEYRDIYMPCNQNPDMTILLGLNNLEMDWAIWGHQLSRVLGSNGDTNFGFQNMSSDLFARSDGLAHSEQFCFSSDKLYELTVNYILEQYGDGTKHPNRFTIGPNDNGIVCECRKCETAGNTKGNATPTVIRFIERLAARFPNHTFFIPGYSTTKAIPDHKLPANVGVFLSAMDYPRAYHNADSPEAQAFFRELEEWKKVTDLVYIWDYICNFDDYLTPYPILSVMQDRFKEYRDRGVKGIFLNGSGYFYSTLQECYTFALSELMINPELDIEYLVRTYFHDSMPHVGDFCADVFLTMEKVCCQRGRELPLYGGIADALHCYIDINLYHELYSKFLTFNRDEMTARERAIYDKTRQIVSYSYLEICRYVGLGRGGYATQNGDRWEINPEMLSAAEALKEITDEDDIYILTDNDYASMDHMDRINEEGVYIADYESECEIWLNHEPWKTDKLLGSHLAVYSGGEKTHTGKLTDGVVGISQSYHWGWKIYPQENFMIELPADKLKDASQLAMGFLNYERHNMAPPSDVELWVDDIFVKSFRKESITEWYDEGERIVFRAHINIPDANKVELHFIPSKTKVKSFAIDEIIAD